MPDFNASYVSLKPTKYSRLNFSDARDLISFISEFSKRSFIELVIKSQNSHGLELFIGLDTSNVKAATKQIYSISPEIVVDRVKKHDVHIDKPQSNPEL
ncbi:MAG: hypothetical protein WDN66_05255 [Candidatus Saccharibacteria bacterium]